MAASKERSEQLRQQMAAQREDQGQGNEELTAIKSKLNEQRARFKQLLEKRREVRDQLEAVTKARDASRSSLRELKSSMKFTSVEAIDEKIAELEGQQQHGSLSLAQEKAVVAQIRTLTKSKAAVAELTAQLGQVESEDGARDGLQAEAKRLTEELTAARAAGGGAQGRGGGRRAGGGRRGGD